ncbi:outer membrane protein TolC [Breznakibacter xylanolyticus]|uniref:Outer membrane protein TolC n=1 Tax=Breznakibacter xylanolyticus TaxID=990 RepID=A0A2W7QFD9_9BACT|nr:TolC family protein [Breznakibacter xylanolyticus]PZX20649.1 outer membrane protein TolC [Breznakibacter xylanolyticus]
MKRLFILIMICSLGSAGVTAQAPAEESELQLLVNKALQHSEALKIRQLEVEKSRIDRRRAYSAYLPKITAEASYTYMNAPIEFPDDLKMLLSKTQTLLVKETAAMATFQLPAGTQGKVDFSTPYQVTLPDGTAMQTSLGTLVQQNTKEIPPIQERDFMKANINAQMLLFSGLKVPYSLKAANHQIAARNLQSQGQEADIIREVVDVYDQLAVLAQSEQTINQTETLLNEQKRFVDKALANGLTIDLNRQKIDLAIEQLKVKRIELNTGRQLLSMKMEELTGVPSSQIMAMSPTVAPWGVLTGAESADNRPEIKALDEAILATDYKRKSENTDYLPKVMAFGKKELITESLTMLDPEWYVGVGVKWTLFDGMTARYNARQSAIDRDILSQRRSETLQMANIKLEKDRLDVTKCNQLIETAHRQKELAAGMVRLSQRQMEQGLVTMNDHLAVIADYEKASLNLIRCIADQRKATAAYLQSSGMLTPENVK